MIDKEEEVTAWKTAVQMINEDIRPPIVHAATGIAKGLLRSKYRQVHGRPAPQGRVSGFAYSRIKNKTQLLEALAFYQIYRRMGGEVILQVLDNNVFLEAYGAYKYKANSARIDATTAWCLARDLLGNFLAPRKCKKCGRMYLYDPRSVLMIRCPLCEG